MKTNAIMRCIANAEVDTWANMNDTEKLQIEAIEQLSAIQIALAEKDDGIRIILDDAHDGYERSENATLLDIIGLCNSYLSQPTGKVLIDIEQLRKIEWVSIATRVGITCCPACGWSKDCGGHAKDCWIGKELKDTP